MYSPGCYNATIPGDATEADDMAVPACLKECAQKDKVYAFLQANVVLIDKFIPKYFFDFFPISAT